MMIQKISSTFRQKFGREPLLIKSPGRVNLIGEHTDYNDGFVLPAAVDKAIYFAISPNDKHAYRFYAYDLSESFETPVDQIEKSDVHWANYLLGVIAQFVKEGKQLTGFDCVFGGDVPLGAGMSSSAAIECGIAMAINHLNNFEYSTLQLTQFAQKAEHEYAGVQCGIMDQFASMHGEINQVIQLDCRSLDYKLFPLDMSNHLLVLVNTGVKHALASSEYNIRRQECEAGVALLKKYDSGITALRDVELDFLNLHADDFSENIFKRSSYIVEENLRVLEACDALQQTDFKKFGQLMYQSHAGLRDKFEVSCSELDQLVEIARHIPGVLGARMMGGGFGGCTINLVERNSVAHFEDIIRKSYLTPEQTQPQIIEVVIDQGTQIISDF